MFNIFVIAIRLLQFLFHFFELLFQNFHIFFQPICRSRWFISDMQLIRADIDYAISLSESYEEFLEQMRSLHYQIREGTSQEEGAILSLKLPGQGKAWRTKKKTLGEAYTVAAIRERIGKEWKSYPIPKSPKLQRCQMRSDFSELIHQFF